MNPAELRHRSVLQPPPQHPSNLRSLSKTQVTTSVPFCQPTPEDYPGITCRNVSQDTDEQLRPPIPPRTPSFLRKSPELFNKMQSQEASSLNHLDVAIPPKHPSLSPRSSKSPLYTNDSEYKSVLLSTLPSPSASAVTDTSSTAASCIPPLRPTELSHVGASEADVSEEISKPSDRSITLDSNDENLLSDRELRDLHDDDEINHFLRLFSAHVKEVKLQTSSAADTDASMTEGVIDLEEFDAMDDEDWFPVDKSTTPKSPKNQNLCLSEQIASSYIIPLLPLTSPLRPSFSLGRLRLTVQRLYLTLEPAYRFLISDLLFLAGWQDKSLSGRYCVGFWVLWLHDLLLPSFMLYLLFFLLRRKLHPYHTFRELRERREQVDNAKEFGEQLQMQFATSSSFRVQEVWRLAQLLNLSRKHITRTSGKPGKQKEREDRDSENQPDDASLLDDQNEITKEEDIKAMLLEFVTELIDGLERLNNIFLWRRPAVSNAFVICLGALFVMTLLIPAQYLAKLFYFAVGFAFWHVTPIIIVIPSQDRRRFMSLLRRFPTDADYAMELIAQRVASGQPIKALRKRRRSLASTSMLGGGSISSGELSDEDKMFDLSARGKLKNGLSLLTTVASASVKLVTGVPSIQKVLAPAAKEAIGETRTYPCQRGKTPGIITLTATTLFFTSLLSSRAKITIPLDKITGIKKGFSRAISIKLDETNRPTAEKFMLVYERDDLFARLACSGGRKWSKV